jgi:hypothetical protein
VALSVRLPFPSPLPLEGVLTFCPSRPSVLLGNRGLGQGVWECDGGSDAEGEVDGGRCVFFRLLLFCVEADEEQELTKSSNAEQAQLDAMKKKKNKKSNEKTMAHPTTKAYFKVRLTCSLLDVLANPCSLVYPRNVGKGEAGERGHDLG